MDSHILPSSTFVLSFDPGDQSPGHDHIPQRPRRQHTVSLPLLEACWGPEHALSRYELGENSSSGLVSMIWWEVLLSSNGIWQLTGGGLWELGSWADGRRLDEDVGGMGRPGKEDRGVKGQHEWHESIQSKLHWNPFTMQLSIKNEPIHERLPTSHPNLPPVAWCSYISQNSRFR